jgi:hypothetical protein
LVWKRKWWALGVASAIVGIALLVMARRRHWGGVSEWAGVVVSAAAFGGTLVLLRQGQRSLQQQHEALDDERQEREAEQRRRARAEVRNIHLRILEQEHKIVVVVSNDNQHGPIYAVEVRVQDFDAPNAGQRTERWGVISPGDKESLVLARSPATVERYWATLWFMDENGNRWMVDSEGRLLAPSYDAVPRSDPRDS